MRSRFRVVVWVTVLGALGCADAAPTTPPGSAGRGSSGAAGSTSGVGGSQAGEGGESGDAGEAGRGGGGRGGTGGAGRGGTGGAFAGGTGGRSDSGGKAGSSGTAGTTGDPCARVTCSGHGTCSSTSGSAECTCEPGYASPSDAPTRCDDVDECLTANGGCDVLTSCTNRDGGRDCGSCPDGYGGSGESGCVPKPCTGDPGVDCPCMKVAPDGDDVAAVQSWGRTPFASLQSAIDFADTHRSIALDVCVASAAVCCLPGGAGCEVTPSHSGPGGGPVVMRNGISVFGGYESSDFTRCAEQMFAELVPGVEVGEGVQAPTTLDRFHVRRAGVVVRGARELTLSRLGIENDGGSGTWTGIDVRDGAKVAISSASILSDLFDPGTPGELVGIRSLGSQVSVLGTRVTLYSGGGTAVGVWLEDSPGSTLDVPSVRLETGWTVPETTLTGLRVLASEGFVMSGGSVRLAGGSSDFPIHHFGVDLRDSLDASLVGIEVSTDGASGTTVGLLALRSTIELSGLVRIRPDGPAGEAVVLTDAPASRVSATIDVQGRDDAAAGFWGVHLSGDAANVEIAESVILATAFVGGAGGIFIDGADATGLEIRETTITASGLDGEVTGIRLEDCGGAEPSIRQNPSILASSRGGTAPVRAILAAGDCHPRIEQNALVASIGESGGGSNHTAIHCAALSGVPSRCAITDNPDVRTESLLATPATADDAVITGTGIHCAGGSCAAITGNEVTGLVVGIGSCQRSCVVQSYGLHLEATDALVAENVIHAGCGGVARGILAEQTATARVENNFVYGRSTDEDCGTVPTGAMISSSIGIVASSMDVHSNLVRAGGSQRSFQGGCTSAAISVGGASVRNNLLATGECETRYVAMSSSWVSPFEHNDLAPDASLTALFAPNLDLAAVNAQPNSSGNVSGCGSPPTSVCVDGGTAAGAPTLDFYGNPRDTLPDIGPVEWIAPPP